MSDAVLMAVIERPAARPKDPETAYRTKAADNRDQPLWTMHCGLAPKPRSMTPRRDAFTAVAIMPAKARQSADAGMPRKLNAAAEVSQSGELPPGVCCS